MAYAERSKGKLTGRWCADVTYKYPDGLTKRWHKAFKTKGEAEGFEAYVRATGDVPPGVLGKPQNTFAAVADRFKQRNPAWVSDRVNAQRLQFALDHLGPLDIRAIRRPQLEKYVDTLMSKCGRGDAPPANNTINNYLSAVRIVLDYAHKLDMIEGMPSFPRLPMTGKKRQAVSRQMETAICNRLNSEGHADCAFLVRVLAATGMRRGELYALRPEQIETPEQVENTGWQLSEEQTKTNEARWVPCLPDAARKLRAMIAANRLPDAADLSKLFSKAAKALGDTEGLTLHCLRHTTATRLGEVEPNALIIAKLLGHSTGIMTSRYLHPSKAQLFEVAKKVQNGLGEMPQMGAVVPLKSNENLSAYGA